MKEKPIDLRVIRTKEAIRNALIQLIDEKGFEAITVKDITTTAKINRGTFYAHYQDKYDLMTKCEEGILNELFTIIQHKLPSVQEIDKQNVQPLTLLPVAISVFQYLNEHRHFMRAVLSPKGDLSFQTKIKHFIWEALFIRNASKLVNEKNLLIPSQYFAAYLSSAHIGVIQQWLNSGCKESPEEMATILSTVTINGPFYAAGLKT